MLGCWFISIDSTLLLAGILVEVFGDIGYQLNKNERQSERNYNCACCREENEIDAVLIDLCIRGKWAWTWTWSGKKGAGS